MDKKLTSMLGGWADIPVGRMERTAEALVTLFLEPSQDPLPAIEQTRLKVLHKSKGFPVNWSHFSRKLYRIP